MALSDFVTFSSQVFFPCTLASPHSPKTSIEDFMTYFFLISFCFLQQKKVSLSYSLNMRGKRTFKKHINNAHKQ